MAFVAPVSYTHLLYLINHYILVQFQSISLFDGKSICLLVNMLCMHNSSYTCLLYTSATISVPELMATAGKYFRKVYKGNKAHIDFKIQLVPVTGNPSFQRLYLSLIHI